MSSDFHSNLSKYLRAKETEKAFKLVLDELAVCLAKDKENFVAILNNAGISASVEDSDTVLIEKFAQNAMANQKLLVGAAMLINDKNKVANFDGELEVSDAGVKNTYHVLQSNFIGDEEYSEVAPLIAAGAKAIFGAGKGKKEAAEKKAQAESQMRIKVLQQKRLEAARQAKLKAEAKKKTTNMLIIGGSVLLVVVLGIVIYKARK